MVTPSSIAAASLLLVVLLIAASFGYPDYQTAIPNGNRVPYPCAKGQAWLGVGHVSPAGGGGRNPFGVDFAKNGKKWTPELCRADSDHDGRSNGEELGDPDCQWTAGGIPSRLDDITHPGVCEPLSSPACRKYNSWLKCTPGTFECDAFDDKDLRNITLRMPPATPVPAEETTYSCMLYRLPTDTSYHLVATKPLLNNTRVVHHMLLFGCRDDGNLKESQKPYRCEMVPDDKCQEVIVTWTIGIQGDCLHKDAGFRLGKHGYKMVALQVHWNNPTASGEFTDSSGLVVYFTPNLRKYDAGLLVFGHIYLQVDPVTERASTCSGSNSSSTMQTYTSTCPQHCMEKMFNTTIYITTAINHMHYNGKTQLMELLRDGKKVQDIAWDPTFDYDSPVAHRLDPPITLHPGDEIRTTCTFRRPKSGQPVCYGRATLDEMCFGFLTYFPVQPHLVQPWCTSRRSLISCERTLPSLWERPIDGCAWRSFIRPPSPEALTIIKKVLAACYALEDGGARPALACSAPSCREALQETGRHACFVGDVGYYIVAKIRQYLTERRAGELFASAWYTCNCDREYDYCEVGGATRGPDGRDLKAELCQGGWAGAITDGSHSAARSVNAGMGAWFTVTMTVYGALLMCQCLLRSTCSLGLDLVML